MISLKVQAQDCVHAPYPPPMYDIAEGTGARLTRVEVHVEHTVSVILASCIYSALVSRLYSRTVGHGVEDVFMDSQL